MVKTSGSRLTAKRKNQSNLINFERKPSNWSNIVFLSEQKNVYYIRESRKEIYPLLKTEDAIIPLNLGTIFPNARANNINLFTEQERKLGKLIRIYYQNEDGKILDPESRVYGSFFRDDSEIMNLLINDRDLIFTEQDRLYLKTHILGDEDLT